jgi:hypothetical protein
MDVSSVMRALKGGGTAGNERLTAMTGLLLIVVLAAVGVTIVRIGQLLWLHLFLGLVLIGPVALKLLSTGYRFIRYYTRSPRYRRRGPPHTALRMLAPLVVLSTLAVLVTGVALLLLGPSSRGWLVLVHKVSFFAWIAVTGVHVLGHLPELTRLTRRPAGELTAAGRGGRRLSLLMALMVGLVCAVALLGRFSAWTHHGGSGVHEPGSSRASRRAGSNSSIGLPDGSSTRICRPPTPSTISLRNRAPCSRNRATISVRSPTSSWKRFQPPGLGSAPSGIA